MELKAVDSDLTWRKDTVLGESREGRMCSSRSR